MKKPTMTLPDIQRALAEQDRQLCAAYQAFGEPGGVRVPAGAIERLEEVCGASPGPPVERRPSNGIRC